MTEATQKRSIFGFLKEAFVEEVPDKPATTRSQPPPDVPVATPTKVGIKVGSTVEVAEADPAALAKLEDRLQRSLPPEYASFMEQYEALRDVIPDENTRFKAALKTSHCSAEQIVGALDKLLGTMEGAHSDFLKSFEEKKTATLGKLQESIKATGDLIMAKEAQLKAIEEEIQSLHSKRDADAQHALDEGQRLDHIRTGFEAAHALVTRRLTTQKDRIAGMPKG